MEAIIKTRREVIEIVEKNLASDLLALDDEDVLDDSPQKKLIECSKGWVRIAKAEAGFMAAEVERVAFLEGTIATMVDLLQGAAAADDTADEESKKELAEKLRFFQKDHYFYKYLERYVKSNPAQIALIINEITEYVILTGKLDVKDMVNYLEGFPCSLPEDELNCVDGSRNRLFASLRLLKSQPVYERVILRAHYSVMEDYRQMVEAYLPDGDKVHAESAAEFIVGVCDQSKNTNKVSSFKVPLEEAWHIYDSYEERLSKALAGEEDSRKDKVKKVVEFLRAHPVADERGEAYYYDEHGGKYNKLDAVHGGKSVFRACNATEVYRYDAVSKKYVFEGSDGAVQVDISPVDYVLGKFLKEIDVIAPAEEVSLAKLGGAFNDDETNWKSDVGDLKLAVEECLLPRIEIDDCERGHVVEGNRLLYNVLSLYGREFYKAVLDSKFGSAVDQRDLFEFMYLSLTRDQCFTEVIFALAFAPISPRALVAEVKSGTYSDAFKDMALENLMNSIAILHNTLNKDGDDYEDELKKQQLEGVAKVWIESALGDPAMQSDFSDMVLSIGEASFAAAIFEQEDEMGRKVIIQKIIDEYKDINLLEGLLSEIDKLGVKLSADCMYSVVLFCLRNPAMSEAKVDEVISSFVATTNRDHLDKGEARKCNELCLQSAVLDSQVYRPKTTYNCIFGDGNEVEFNHSKSAVIGAFNNAPLMERLEGWVLADMDRERAIKAKKMSDEIMASVLQKLDLDDILGSTGIMKKSILIFLANHQEIIDSGFLENAANKAKFVNDLAACVDADECVIDTKRFIQTIKELPRLVEASQGVAPNRHGIAAGAGGFGVVALGDDAGVPLSGIMPGRK